MNRYENIQIVKNASKVRYYTDNKYPDIPLSETDLYLIVAAGDRFDLLAYRYYKDTSLWWIIPTANNLSCDSMFPDIGIQIRIPLDIESILKSYKELNED